jgi:subtilase family serine protease
MWQQLPRHDGARVTPDEIGEPGGYDPAELRAYLKLHGTGAGQTVAVTVPLNVRATVMASLPTYDDWYGLPGICSAAITTGCFHLTFAAPDGAVDNNPGLLGWPAEAATEVELLHALVPMASIEVVEARETTLASLLRAVRYAQSTHPDAISEPWSSAEFSGEQADNDACPATGAICVAPSGDCGHYPEKSCPGALVGGYPAADPGVLSVGGTTLELAPSGRVKSETAWDGSGGGISEYEPQPGYQRAADPHRTGRGIPDVSFAADPETGAAGFAHVIFVYRGHRLVFKPNWGLWGGTALGVQAWTAIIASADQLRAAAGRSPLTIGELQAAVYAKGAKPIADITSGANGVCALCSAGPGYDLVTGEGSPRPGIDSYLAGQ